MSLLDILEFEAPLSRVEEILQNILGASNEVDPESRVEKLLQNLIEVAYEVDPDSRVEFLLDNLLGGHNEVVPMSRVEMLIANALGESYDVAPQSRVEELLVLLAEQYAVEYKTVSGSVVSISDALEAPVKSLKVAIDPVQDLHGQENPYPAGGGKNKCLPYTDRASHNGITYTVTSEGINVSGTATASSYSYGAPYTYADSPIKLPAGTYTFSSSAVPGSEQTNGYLVFMGITESGTAISNIVLAGTTLAKSVTFSEPVGIFYGIYVANGQTVNVNCQIMIESGNSKTDFAPYSNICPISGWTSVDVGQTGKNLLTYVPNKITAPLSVTLDKTRATLVKKGITYSMSFDMQNATTWRICAVLFDLEGNRHFVDGENPFGTVIPYLNSNASGQYYVWGTNYTYKSFVITPIDDFYVMFFFLLGDTSASTVMVNPMLEIGSTATPYEPYTGNTYPVSWETEAGTVYGGTLDVVSGELVVNRASVDLGTLTWTKKKDAVYCTTGLIGQITEPSTYLEKASVACTQYESASYIKMWSDAKDKSVTVIWGASGLHGELWIRDSAYSDLITFKTAMSGVQLVFELAEPQTYHLTPTEVRTLLGQNNVWADTGDVEVTYLAKKH